MSNDIAHGNCGNGPLHAVATTEPAGFMSAEDKVALDDLAVGFLSGLILAPANKDYRLLINAPAAITVNSVTTISASGTCTATLKIGAVALGGAANAVSSSQQSQAHTTANEINAGDDLTLTVSANAACVDLSYTVEYTRIP